MQDLRGFVVDFLPLGLVDRIPRGLHHLEERGALLAVGPVDAGDGVGMQKAPDDAVRVERCTSRICQQHAGEGALTQHLGAPRDFKEARLCLDADLLQHLDHRLDDERIADDVAGAALNVDAEAVWIPGFGQQLLGSLRIIGILRYSRVVAEVCRRGPLRNRLGMATKQGLRQLLAVDREIERQPHTSILQWLIAAEKEDVRGVCRRFGDVGAPARVDAVGEIDGDVDHDVDFSRGQCGHAGELVTDRSEHDLGKFRRLTPVGRVGLEDEHVVLVPLGELVWPGADRLARKPFGPDLLEVPGRQHLCAPLRQSRGQQWVGLLRDDVDDVRVGSLHFLDGGEAARDLR